MEIDVNVRVPKFIYDIYVDASKDIGKYSVEQVMSSALVAYAQYLFQEMISNGDLASDDTLQEK